MELSGILGEEGVVDASSMGFARYKANTLGAERQIKGVLRIKSRDQLPPLLNLANRKNLKLYPVSTGKNWGYGDYLPVENDCWVVDLSALNRILHFDEELKTVHVEPGVTQKQLYDFLQSRESNLMVPTTGAGPDCSLIGNALEKGYGITPYADHFLAIKKWDVLLANGDYLRSPLSRLGGVETDRIFKWGVGPYLDGLFCQSNFGVVVGATIELAERPEHFETFVFSFEHHKLSDMALAVKELKSQMGSFCSGINFMNSRRVLAMATPAETIPKVNGLVDERWVIDQMRQQGLSGFIGNQWRVPNETAIFLCRIKGLWLIFIKPIG